MLTWLFVSRDICCPSLGPSGPVGLLPASMSVCVSVHWLCGSDDQTCGVMGWQYGRLTGMAMQSLVPVGDQLQTSGTILTGMTMQSLGVVIQWQIARYDHAR